MRFLPLLWSLLLISCASTSKSPITGVGDTKLSQVEAQKRFNQVSNVKYELEFDLRQTDKNFYGTTTILFDFRNDGNNLRVDFFKGQIASLKVNDKIQEPNYEGQFLNIENSQLVTGPNKIEVKYQRSFNDDGRGFTRFVDPVDNRVYTHTQLEPYKANFVFPCFDQPDLKATYKMKVTAPESWQVITSVMENQKTKTTDGRQIWNFPPSAKFSTYIWSLHAGEYKMFKDKGFKIPLRLFVRQSLAKYVKTKDWFKPTRQGFKYFPKYFAYKYPYIKYDQIIAPGFNSGAMENVAAVTFNESYVKRGEKTRRDRRRLASVIMHEMAHMWFGNLVTMKWWDDLWLNESFATYMAALALYEATEYKEAWRDFNGTKQWAYWEDQLVTTHPIEATIPDTDAASSNFDGITYGKGAASMKQLAFYIGPRKFRKGLRIYFKLHAEGNTKLKDFIGALSAGADRDLIPWQKKWLQTANLNTISVIYECENDKIKDLQVVQTAPAEYPTLRPHRFRLAFLSNSGNSRKVRKSLAISLKDSSKTVKKAVGQSCNAMIDPNYKDYGYFKTKLDKNTTELLKKDILKIKNTMQRQMMWTALWDMVRDGHLDVYTYTKIVLKRASKEQDNINLTTVLGSIYGRFGRGALYYMPQDTPEQVNRYKIFARQAEKIMWKYLLKAEGNSDRQKIWLDAFVKTARTSYGLKRLNKLLTGTKKLKEFEIDQDRRWAMIYQLSRFAFEGSLALIDSEAKFDTSDKGKKSAIQARAAYPTWEQKEKWLKEVKDDESTYNHQELVRMMWNMFPDNQDNLRKKYGEDFYDDLEKVMEERSSTYAASYTAMTPEVCQTATEAPISNFLEQNKGRLHPVISKRLKVSRQEAERCFKIRQAAAAKLKQALDKKKL